MRVGTANYTTANFFSASAVQSLRSAASHIDRESFGRDLLCNYVVRPGQSTELEPVRLSKLHRCSSGCVSAAGGEMVMGTASRAACNNSSRLSPTPLVISRLTDVTCLSSNCSV